MAVDATICIPTFNGEEFIQELLASIENQKTKYSYEVLVIDSGSTDNTLPICKEFASVRILEIPNSEFGHGKTRNLAAQSTDAEFVVFLTQDATPSHAHWLDGLLEPFEMFENVSCVFGKQIPRADCVVTVKREIDSVFQSFGDDASISIQRKTDLTKTFNIVNTFLSDVNSAMRRSCLIQVPFQDLPYAEDQALGTDHLNHGWFKAYSPLGSVFHSHNYPLRKYFMRKMDERIGVYEATGEIHAISFKRRIFGFVDATIRDWLFLKNDKEYGRRLKVKNFFKAPAYNYMLYKCYWMARNPKNHKKYKVHSLEASIRATDKDEQ